MQSMQSYRPTCAYFLIGSLCILKVFSTPEKESQLPFTRTQIIDWIYAHQIGDTQEAQVDEEVGSNENYVLLKDSAYHGFREKCLFRTVLDSDGKVYVHKEDMPHLANTYSSICILKMLGDDFSRLDVEGILACLEKFQREDGRVSCLPTESEDDVRFAYCAAAIHHMLADISGDVDRSPTFNVEKLVEYYKSCLSYDGGFSWIKYGESHSGLTYCLLGTFKLLGKLDELSDHKERIIEHLSFRQPMETNGFQGRINKIPDTCYSFWNTASLAILEPDMFKDFVHVESALEFIEDCRRFGGYAKLSFSDYPDIVHTFYSLAFKALVNEEGLSGFDPLLALPV